MIAWLLETWRMPWFSTSLGFRHRNNDKVLNYIMDNKLEINLEYIHKQFIADFGGIRIWIGNYPYAFGNLAYSNDSSSRPLPTLRTAYRFKLYVDKVTQEATIKMAEENKRYLSLN